MAMESEAKWWVLQLRRENENEANSDIAFFFYYASLPRSYFSPVLRLSSDFFCLVMNTLAYLIHI
jgi:hypothetical protein